MYHRRFVYESQVGPVEYPLPTAEADKRYEHRRRVYETAFGPVFVPSAVIAAVVYPDSYFEQVQPPHHNSFRYDTTAGNIFPLFVIPSVVYTDSYWEPDHRPHSISRSGAWRYAAVGEPDPLNLPPPTPAKHAFYIPQYRRRRR